MILSELVDLYLNDGYNQADANIKVAQDIILLKISKSSLNRNVTIKGGVVMHNISKDKRRATRDMDFDFIKYSLEDSSIRNFIDKLNNVNDGLKIIIKGNIEKLHHQDYEGKRVYITIIDNNGYRIDTKLDIGVCKNFDKEQEEYCFDLNTINESATLFINSKEQIFTEKLKSLLKFAFRSTRYKDIFDFYYLIKYGNLDNKKIEKFINEIIFKDETLDINDFKGVNKKVNEILKNKSFLLKLDNSKVNWLEIPIKDAIEVILKYLNSFTKEYIE